MAVDEFDGTLVTDGDEVLDNFGTNERLPNSKTDQNVYSGMHLHFKNDYTSVSYFRNKYTFLEYILRYTTFDQPSQF